MPIFPLNILILILEHPVFTIDWRQRSRFKKKTMPNRCTCKFCNCIFFKLNNIKLSLITFYPFQCNYLSTIGGSCVKDSTRRVLQQLMSNRLSLNYNWKGTRGIKLGFATFTHITKLILGIFFPLVTFILAQKRPLCRYFSHVGTYSKTTIIEPLIGRMLDRFH